MPASYEIRAGGDGKNKKQSMADLKLRRLNELNLRLKEDLDRPRVTVAQASKESVPTPPTPVTMRPQASIDPKA
jgi:guanine nucleotide-binding protein subunit gamma, fungi